MSKDGYRSNGGLGFFISHPSLSVEILKHSENQLIDLRPIPLPSKSFLKWFKQHLTNNNITEKFRIIISGDTPSHKGFGVSTSIRMATVEGIYKLIGRKVNQEQVILNSHRGGTSGIGVHGYFSGGFIFDLGHKGNKEKHLPSRCHESQSHLPLLMKSLPMPAWQVGILIPTDIIPKTHIEEKTFFEQACPINPNDVYETTYHALFGVLSSVQTANFASFCTAINNVQEQTWKKAERNLYPELRKYESLLKKLGAHAVGMSSLGPSLYFFANDVNDVIDAIKNSSLGSSCDTFIASVANQGRQISHV